ncbi:MAG TPA: hypothetical protein GX505_04935 [Clostridiales bacterium]|nr:hypothetical protein [Clostridiales bacterium]
MPTRCCSPPHNSQTGGYLIILSVAKVIVQVNNGKYQAATEDGHPMTITAAFLA